MELLTEEVARLRVENRRLREALTRTAIHQETALGIIWHCCRACASEWVKLHEPIQHTSDCLLAERSVGDGEE